MSDGPGGVRILSTGESSFLVEFPDAPRTLAAYGRLREAVEQGRRPGVVEIVPAARTVLVSFDGRTDSAASVAAWIRAAAAGEAGASSALRPASALVEIPVRYDGEDIDEAAALAGTDREGLIGLHLAGEWTAAFVGFAPGFAYLTGDPRLTVPRRPAPRAAVPAGSVALAAGYCGVYPRESPGGWQLIGSTDRELWNTAWPQPALLAPGTRVRFVREE